MKKTPELFDAWNVQKKKIEFGRKIIKKLADIGEFWWYWEGVNVGNEISKDGFFKRACLVVNNRLGNGLFLIAPITTKYHSFMKKRLIPVKNYEKYNLKECRIITNQIKLIDKKRLVYKTHDYNKNIRLSAFITKKCVELLFQ